MSNLALLVKVQNSLQRLLNVPEHDGFNREQRTEMLRLLSTEEYKAVLRDSFTKCVKTTRSVRVRYLGIDDIPTMRDTELRFLAGIFMKELKSSGCQVGRSK